MAGFFALACLHLKNRFVRSKKSPHVPVLQRGQLLALLGGMLGLALSFWGTKAFATLVPQWYPQAQEISIDVRVLAFTLAISILTGIMFGLAPALRASKVELIDSLKEGGRSSSGGSHHRTRSILSWQKLRWPWFCWFRQAS
jgi:hypothetical protein